MSEQKSVGEHDHTFEALQERFGPQVEECRQRLSEWNQRAVQLMRERPGTCLLCAVGIGFVVGRLASRR